MENIQNKEVKGEGSHQSGGCHCMLCSVKNGGWHGHHSVLRVGLGILVLLMTFCFGVHVGKWGGHDWHRGDWGHGRGGFEKHMRVNAMYGGGQMQFTTMGQPNVRFDRQVIYGTAGVPVLATATAVMITQ